MNNHRAMRMKSEVLLAGRIFDDRGNRMGPSHARRRGVKYRYYLSSALLQGSAERAGSIARVPAAEIETLVVRAVRGHLRPTEPIDDRSVVNTHVARVEVQLDRLVIRLAHVQKSNCRKETRNRVIHVRWNKAASTRRREILLPRDVTPQNVRPIRSETRATLIASIARGRRWLKELVSSPATNVEGIAKREGCSVRKVNMTISLAFLAPDLVKAAIEGILPRGMGVARLCDLPAEWSRQHLMLGFTPQ
jgi:site-specific DNA recombinase